MSHQLAGRRVLVVEDSPLIAAELWEELEAVGASVVGPAAHLERALDLAAQDKIDAAVLDVDLGDAMSFSVADLLLERSVPIVFTTGFDDGAVRETYGDAPTLIKPAPARDVIAVLTDLLVADRSAA